VLKEEPQREPAVGWNTGQFLKVKFQPNPLTYEPVPVAA
jgi:hypothetical protein